MPGLAWPASAICGCPQGRTISRVLVCQNEDINQQTFFCVLILLVFLNRDVAGSPGAGQGTPGATHLK